MGAERVNDRTIKDHCVANVRLLIKSMNRLRDASEFRAGRSEVADIYPAFWIGSRAVALMGIRTRRWSH